MVGIGCILENSSPDDVTMIFTFIGRQNPFRLADKSPPAPTPPPPSCPCSKWHGEGDRWKTKRDLHVGLHKRQVLCAQSSSVYRTKLNKKVINFKKYTQNFGKIVSRSHTFFFNMADLLWGGGTKHFCRLMHLLSPPPLTTPLALQLLVIYIYFPS